MQHNIRIGFLGPKSSIIMDFVLHLVDYEVGNENNPLSVFRSQEEFLETWRITFAFKEERCVLQVT